MTSRAVLAVLPFESLVSGEVGFDYFSRGFTEDLITDLSRFPELDVLAPHSAARLASGSVGDDAPTVDYLLKGSLRGGHGKLRLTAQLVTPDGHVEWAGRFDEALEEVFEIQDEITAQVVASISSRIQASLLASARRKPITELAAYDCWLRGHDSLRQGTLAADQKARELFVRALERDPDYSRAHLGLSLSYFNEWSCQLWHRWDENEQQAYRHAQRASELDPDDHYARLVLGRVLMFRREFELAEQQLRRAVALNHNDADALVQIAINFGYLGEPDEALRLYERARRLNPYHEPWYYAYGMVPHVVREDWQGTLQCALHTPIDTMVDVAAYRAIAYQNLGEQGLARELVGIYLEQFAHKIAVGRELEAGEALRWALHVNPFRRDEDRGRLRDGLCAAGLDGERTPLPIVAPADRYALRRVGSVWQASFDGRDAHLPNLKGLGDIAVLLSRPSQEIHCAELMGGVDSLGSSDDVIDEQARHAYRARIRELQSELSESEEHNNAGRSEKLRQELDALTEHLEKALGLGGRARKLDAPSERARSAVTWRIRSALKKIEEAHEPLAEHLKATLRTGSFCCYDPQEPIDWKL
ncbi:MAG: hypothetical protein OXU20_38535 [Myxococcales bacterium]|nr:hypothetical protein [Myxococcales bacterium]